MLMLCKTAKKNCQMTGVNVSTYLFLHREFSHTCHHSPQIATHEMGTLCSCPPPFLPQPGWHPGEGSRHPTHRPSHFGPETLPPAHLERLMTDGRNNHGWAATLQYNAEVTTCRPWAITVNLKILAPSGMISGVQTIWWPPQLVKIDLWLCKLTKQTNKQNTICVVARLPTTNK